MVVIGLVELNEPAVVTIGVVDIRGAKTLLLGAVDKGLDLLGWVFFIVHTQASHEPLDGGELILAVEDLKGGRQGGVTVVGSKEPVAKAMKGSNPHALEVHIDHAAEPPEHLASSLIRKGDRQDAQGADPAGGDQPCNSRRQDPGLAAASPSQDQRWLRWKGDRLLLRCVEAL